MHRQCSYFIIQCGGAKVDTSLTREVRTEKPRKGAKVVDTTQVIPELGRAPHPPVLVVEDDAVSAAVISRHLQTLGLANPVQVLTNGSEALGWLSATLAGPACERPALVLLDRHLPGASGLELLRWMHSQPALQGIPVLMLTGASDVNAISEAYSLGACSYLVKPVGFEALGEVIRGLDLTWAILPGRAG